jgi:predicted DNA-binding protein (MmcQ/YjbR family)
MNFEVIDKTLMSYENVSKSFPYGENISVYKAGDMLFALVQNTTNPLRISLRCDERLAALLREKYETVLPGQKLNQKKWNTIILSGQLSDDEIFDLIRHSYNLATNS